ncbi:MAG: MmcQ/YjbR family DNA-binding protein [Oscillospiraceae bacterium]|nr:MmcQ/YjbR family DNA-binding protein [Oscillospiraceae bacterium]
MRIILLTQTVIAPPPRPSCVISVTHKSFAFIFERQGQLCLNLKCDPGDADCLRQAFNAITPAYHMNKRHGNTVAVNAGIPDQLLRQLISASYDLIRPRFKPTGHPDCPQP